MSDTPTSKPVDTKPIEPASDGILRKWSGSNTTAKTTLMVLMVLCLAALWFLGKDAKDIIMTVGGGLVGFLSRDNIKAGTTGGEE